MKKLLIRLLVFSLMFPFSWMLSSAYTANTYVTMGTKHLINGVGQSGNYTRYYWYDTNSLNSVWQTKIESAMYDWCHTGSSGCGVYTSVWFYRTTTKSYSVIDIYNSDIENDSLFGITSYYHGSGSSSVPFDPMTETPGNWVWARIDLDVYLCENGGYTFSGFEIPSLTTQQKKALIEHEMGHAFGLAHVEDLTANRKVLMYPYISNSTASKPTVPDCNGVNYLYGGYNP